MSTLTGILDWPAKADGRVRQLSGAAAGSREEDPLLPPALCDRYKLRSGVEVTVRVGSRGGGGPAPQHQHHHRSRGHQSPRPREQGRGGNRSVVEEIVAIEGLAPDAFVKAGGSGRAFEGLTSIDPQPRLTLEYPGCPASCRLIDLFCPIGRGQRGLIVSPPKAGKTTLLKDIATAILKNHTDVEVWVLLVDERPEEVTDFKRTFAEWTGGTGGAGGGGGNGWGRAAVPRGRIEQ